MAFLVTGATGNQGGALARQLLQQGAKVHALVRNPDSEAAKAIESKGAILFKGDIGDADAISRALKGVTGVFLNPPYRSADSAHATQTFIKTCAAHKESIKIFVLSSAVGTELHAERVKKDPDYSMAASYAEKEAAEILSKQAHFQHLVILRAPFLMHGYLVPFSQVIFADLAQHRLVTALKPDTRVPHLAGDDVGIFAAAALLDPAKFSGQEINLAAQNLTPQDVADAITQVSGVKVDAPVAKFEGDKAVGFKSPVGPFHQWMNETDIFVDPDALNKKYGIPLTTIGAFFTRRREELEKSLGR